MRARTDEGSELRGARAAEVLRVAESTGRSQVPAQVRVRMRLSGVNPTDWKSRAGATPRPIDGFQIPHHDGAGVIDAVGDGVDSGRVGERVWTWLAAAGSRWGTAAQWSVLPSRQAVPLPDGASDELGACLGVPAMTAHWCLFADGPVAGKSVLVAGGAGAVGHFAIELAKFRRAGSRPRSAARRRPSLPGRPAPTWSSTTATPMLLRSCGPSRRRWTGSSSSRSAPTSSLTWPFPGRRTHIVTYAAEAQDPVIPVRKCMNA